MFKCTLWCTLIHWHLVEERNVEYFFKLKNWNVTVPHVFHYILGRFCRCFHLKASKCINRKKTKHNVSDGFKSWLIPNRPLKLSCLTKRAIHSAVQFKKSHAGLLDYRSYTPFHLAFHAVCTLLVPRYILPSHPISWHNSEALFFFFSLCCLSKKSLHPLPPESHPAAARSMKLLAKIPKDAEAVIVLVGKETILIVCRCFCSFSFSLLLKYQSTTSPFVSRVKIFVKALFLAIKNVIFCWNAKHLRLMPMRPFDVAPCKAVWISWNSQQWLSSGWMKQSCWSLSSRSRFLYGLFSSCLVPVSPVWTTTRLDVLSPLSCLTRYMVKFHHCPWDVSQNRRKQTHLKNIAYFLLQRWGEVRWIGNCKIIIIQLLACCMFVKCFAWSLCYYRPCILCMKHLYFPVRWRIPKLLD